jgi:hypothetical protein
MKEYNQWLHTYRGNRMKKPLVIALSETGRG